MNKAAVQEKFSAPQPAPVTESTAATADLLSTADTQPLPVLAEPPGLPVAYEAPGLPVASATPDAFAETVTLPAGEAMFQKEAVPEHPVDPAGTGDTSAPTPEVATTAAPAMPSATDGAGTAQAGETARRPSAEPSVDAAPEEPAPEAGMPEAAEADATTASADEAPAAPPAGDEARDEEPASTQRYTVWSSGPAAGSYHFGPKDE